MTITEYYDVLFGLSGIVCASLYWSAILGAIK